MQCSKAERVAEECFFTLSKMIPWGWGISIHCLFHLKFNWTMFSVVEESAARSGSYLQLKTIKCCSPSTPTNASFQSSFKKQKKNKILIIRHKIDHLRVFMFSHNWVLFLHACFESLLIFIFVFNNPFPMAIDKSGAPHLRSSY